MIEFKNMHLSNYVLFDNAKFDMGYQGITLINGQNKNIVERRSNGAGKSLLTSALPNLWFGVDPTITVSKSRAKRDAFYRKGASLKLDMKFGDDPCTIEKFLKGQSIKYKIKYKNQNREHTTATSAETWMNENFPLTEDQFYSLVYLDSRRPNLSLSGSGSNRFSFFANLFSLDAYDALKDHFTAALKTLQMEKNELKVWQEQYDDYCEQLEKIENKLNGTTKKDLEVESKKIEKFRDLLFRLKQAKVKIDNHQETVTYDENKEKKLKSLLEKLKSQRIAHNQYITWEKENEKYRIKLEKYRKEYSQCLKNIKHDCSCDSLAKTAVRMADKIDEIEEKLSRYDVDKKEYDKLTSYNIEKPRYPSKDIEKLITKKESKLELIEQQLEKIKNVKDGTCPMCGSEFDEKHLAKEKKELKTQIEKIESDLQTQREYLKDIQKYEKWTKKLKEIDLNVDVKSLKTKLKDLKEQKTFVVSAEEYKNKLDSLKVVKKPKHAKMCNIELCENEIDKIQKALDKQIKAKHTVSLSEELKQLGFESVEDWKEKKAKVKNVDVEAKNSRLLKLSSSIEQKERIEPEIEKLKTKIDTITKRISKINVLNALVGAYSNSGLKRYACGEIAKRVEANINKFSHLIFDEKFKFHFDVTPTDFLIQYEDRRGTFDIRNLSGAESRSFTVLSMLGLLPLIPASMRCNVLILDEMDSHMDPILSEMFYQDLIPALNTIIPHVIVVTNETVTIPDSRTVTVVKDGTTSSLKL